MNTDVRHIQLRELLRRHGTRSAAELALDLGISQPTVSRLVQAAALDVVALGRARATRYALGHAIGREGSRWPLYRLDAQAHPQRLGHLQALHGDRFHFQPDRPLPAFTHDEFADGLYPGLPWWLDDQRPQGFLGRSFARRVATEIGAAPDLKVWQADDIVLALLRFGDDQPGDLILGDHALATAMADVLQPRDVIDAADVAEAYARRADAALQGDAVGSSAAGEQPKFTVILRDGGALRRMIVKFSERGRGHGAQRWEDLLHCEHLAGEVLNQHGLAAARSGIVQADGRVFLQSERFDRTPAGGRHGFVSLAALDAAHYGHGRIDWWLFAEQLQRDGWISAPDARRLALYGWFGALIGNTDMHLGNAGLLLTDARPLALAPSYDMLPMAWRPSAHGEVLARTHQPPLPTPQQQPLWREAADMALNFWRQAQALPALSEDFRVIAIDAATQLTHAVAKFG